MSDSSVSLLYRGCWRQAISNSSNYLVNVIEPSNNSLNLLLCLCRILNFRRNRPRTVFITWIMFLCYGAMVTVHSLTYIIITLLQVCWKVHECTLKLVKMLLQQVFCSRTHFGTRDTPRPSSRLGCGRPDSWLLMSFCQLCASFFSTGQSFHVAFGCRKNYYFVSITSRSNGWIFLCWCQTIEPCLTTSITDSWDA
jgi:hypothetical protein